MGALTQNKKILFLSDLPLPPFDEGAKVAAKNLCEQLKVAKLGNFEQINGGLCSLSTIGRLIGCKAGHVLYFPSQSITFNSFLRAKLINLVSRKKIILISCQPRAYKPWQKRIICKIQPYKIFVQSKELKESLEKIGLKNVLINAWGVDLEKFFPVGQEKKNLLRKKYNIPANQKVYLHFGHLNKDRNFDELEMVVKAGPNNYVLIVCSTTTDQKRELKEKLEKKGFHFIVEFVENNQELYQLADYYIFPTINKTSAIEFPLSVFEALACGIPVFHKNFGALKDVFDQDYSNLHYYVKPEELLNVNFSCRHNFPIYDYSWKKVTVDLLKKIKDKE